MCLRLLTKWQEIKYNTEAVVVATYVCSDIHGRYDRYMRMLTEIQFSSTDELYVLGDVIDRNPDGIDILLDIQKRQNIQLLLGNHELFMIDSIVDNTTEEVAVDGTRFYAWTHPRNGGIITFNRFSGLEYATRKSLLEMLKSCLVIKVISIGEKVYHLSHSSTIDGFVDGELRCADTDYDTLKSIVWKSVFRYDKYNDDIEKYNKDITYIVGHVPVQRNSACEFLQMGNIIDIDCGCAYPSIESNRLGCLRLDDMKEFYIE